MWSLHARHIHIPSIAVNKTPLSLINIGLEKLKTMWLPCKAKEEEKIYTNSNIYNDYGGQYLLALALTLKTQMKLSLQEYLKYYKTFSDDQLTCMTLININIVIISIFDCLS